MRHVLEARLEADLGHAQVRRGQQPVREIKSPGAQPFARSGVEGFPKVAFEFGKTSSGKISELGKG